MTSFFVNDTSTSNIYTLSLHDALPILCHTELSVIAIIGILLLIGIVKKNAILMVDFALEAEREVHHQNGVLRSEEHTSELQSLRHLVCRLLLEKKNKNARNTRMSGMRR